MMLKENDYPGDSTELLEQKNRYLIQLGSATVAMMAQHDLDDLLGEVTQLVESLAGAAAAEIAVLHESREYLKTVAASASLHQNMGRRIGPDEIIFGPVWQSGEPIYVKDCQIFGELRIFPDSVVQACGLPITLNGEVVGVIAIQFHEVDPLMQDYRCILQQFSQLCSAAFANTRFIENCQIELTRTLAISDLSKSYFGIASLHTLLDTTCRKILSTFSTRAAKAYRLDAQGQFEGVCALEMSDDQIVLAPVASAQEMESSVARWSLENNETVYIPAGVTDVREDPSFRTLRTSWGLGSSLTIPLTHENQPWGVLTANRDISQPDFDQNEINLIRSVGSQLSLAIHRYGLLQKVEHQAFHDSLTGLPNRLHLETLLEVILEEAETYSESYALLFIDLDGFKNVNDALGHNIGDQLLVQVSQRIARNLDEKDVIGRLGGDEFAVMIKQSEGMEAAESVGLRIIESLNADFQIHNLTARVGASIGVSVYPKDGVNSMELLRNADIAMYQAKNLGKNRVQVFTQEMADRYHQRVSLESDLKIALRKNQFQLYFQPQVCSSSGKVVGLEALIRWFHPDRGLVPPMEFVSIAEDTGLINEIGSWVLNEACRQLAEWRQAGRPSVRVSINISAIQFAQEDFKQLVLDMLEKHQIPRGVLELEVTESVVMVDVESVIADLAELREAGVRIALDDFGTGYSSLSYLQDLPLDVLKVDRAFVTRMYEDDGGYAMVNTIVFLAKTYSLETVAEGVETQQQLEKLTELGCELIQGYYYAPPVSVVDLPGVLMNIESSWRKDHQHAA